MYMFSVDFFITFLSNLVTGVLLPSPLVGPFITLPPMGFVDLVCYNITDNNLRFQWSKNNVNINSASSRLYTVNVNGSTSNWGIYCCSIYDTLGNVIDQRCAVVYTGRELLALLLCYHTNFL